MMTTGHMDGDWSWAGWLGMALMMLLFIALIAAVVMLVLRGTQTSAGISTRRPVTDAEAILAERFARGEIDVTEFTERRAHLRSP